MRKFLFLIVLIFSGIAVCGQENANAILNEVYTRFQKARDYSADANITIDIAFIRMLPINAKIYYKQKDKFKVDTKGIAIVPREGFNQSSKILSDTNSFTAIIQGKEMINTIETMIINIIPLSDTSDLILGKLWIDQNESVIYKSQLTTRSSGTILIEYTYGKEIQFGLPDKIVFTIDTKKFKIPKGMTVDLDKKAEQDTQKDEKKKGKIFISLSNYQVNKGISDDVFKK